MVNTILMYLPANSNNCVSPGMILTVFPPLILGHIFELLYMPGNIFQCMSDIVIFPYWIGLFCIPTNILSLLRVQETHLEIVLFLKFNRWNKWMGSLELIISYYWGKTILSILIIVPWIISFSILTDKKKHYFKPCMGNRYYSL